MKSYDFEAVVYEGEIYCRECSPVATNEADPIFADSEWDSYPVCSVCSYVHDYVSLLS